MQKRKRCLKWIVPMFCAVILSTASLLSVQAGNSPTISEVELRAEGIKLPKAGEKIPAATPLTVVDTANFEPVQGSANWMVEENNSWRKIDRGVFEENKIYSLKVNVEKLRIRSVSAFTNKILKVKVNDITVVPVQDSDYHKSSTIDVKFIMQSEPYKPEKAAPKPQKPEPEKPEPPKPQPQPQEPKKAGWKELAGGRWEYRLENGERLTSAWKGDYYLKKDGIMADNEWIYDQKLKAWYYLKKGGRYARNEWQGAYYLKKHGNMASAEWIYDEHYKGWYYLTKEGSYARSTWQGNYYLGKYGKMVVSDWVYDKNYRAWYYLTAEGSYARNTVIDGKYRIGADGKYIR
ncbi:MAG: hypothetical protein Q4D52_01360 [Eubacteriales bacterium]|nr:hypothetical protein [Eubacteriales bacterium]